MSRIELIVQTSDSSSDALPLLRLTLSDRVVDIPNALKTQLPLWLQDVDAPNIKIYLLTNVKIKDLKVSYYHS